MAFWEREGERDRGRREGEGEGEIVEGEEEKGRGERASKNVQPVSRLHTPFLTQVKTRQGDIKEEKLTLRPEDKMHIYKHRNTDT